MHNFCIKILIITILCLSSWNALAQITIQTSVDSTQVELGNPIKLTYNLKVGYGANVKQVEFKNNIIVDGLEVIENLKPDTIANLDNTCNLIYSYLITSYYDSLYTIPKQKFIVNDKEIFSDSLVVGFTLLQIDSTFSEQIKNIDTTQIARIFDIVDIKNTPFTFEEFWHRFGKMIMIILFAMIIGGVVVWIILRRLKNKPIIPVKKVIEPAHVIAKRDLTWLKEKNLCQQNRHKEYYSLLTHIIKTYITNRYGTSVMESTSDETLAFFMSVVNMQSKEFVDLQNIFRIADFVKFAKLSPDENDNITCLENAFSLVESTKEEIQPTDNQENIQNNTEPKN